MSADRTPIEPSEIRAGDSLRWEGRMDDLFQVREFIALYDKHMAGWGHCGQFYLLDRPTSPVELPTEPTLGFVTSSGRTSPAVVALPSKFNPLGGRDLIYARATDPFGWDCVDQITAFIPATAVPTEALDELRKYRQQLDFGCATPAVRRIDTFLTAVDEANGAAS